MNTLQEKLREKLQVALRREASESDEKIIANAEQDPKPESVPSPADGETGAAADIITNSVGAAGRTQPGTASAVDKVDAENAGDGGIDAAVVSVNKDGEAAKELGVKEGEISKEEGLDMIKKAASQIKRRGAEIQAMPTEEIVGAFNKKASASDNPQVLLYKAACSGDTAAQHLVDMLASYEVGLNKKAADMEEAIKATGAESPEQVAALEEALNAEALQNPEALMEEGEVDEAAAGLDEAAQEALAEAGAQIEEAAQEATVEVASALMDADPNLSEDAALNLAQKSVVDAIQTIDVQQLLGAMDEDGNYLIGDEDAANAVDELKKSASANPLRDSLVADLNAHFGLNPEAFATRLGFVK